ncbi:MAG: excinuclease ABC subunit UvrA [Bacteroidia bacterium]|nr:excinuclease ABC subunit UvrA [Bacteroidia bacterium]
MNDTLEVIGARSNNLKNIHILIPRNKFVVITGPSGSGKSSLAFETIYAEGQRRYLDTLSSYARQFMGNLDRPDVDKINGLSPVIAIEQKTVNKNPRSTVGTITEIYDFLRLLFSKIAIPYSSKTNIPLIKYSEKEIPEIISKQYKNYPITILCPLVKGRKGHYRELFEEWAKKGYQKFRIDGIIQSYKKGLQLDRYKIHNIELIIDHLKPDDTSSQRLQKTIQLGLKIGKGSVYVLEESGNIKLFSTNFSDPDTGNFIDEPSPNFFSFNSPFGACPFCKGIGHIYEPDMEKMVPNPKLSIPDGAIVPLGKNKNNWIFKQVISILKMFSIPEKTPFCKLSEEVVHTIFYGTTETVVIEFDGISFNTTFDGIAHYLAHKSDDDSRLQKWASSFTTKKNCPECSGSRLKKESLLFKINNKNIYEWSQIPMSELPNDLEMLNKKLSSSQKIIARDILREISDRVQFLNQVGLNYLTLHRPASSLSGGEAQRIRLATQIGSRLTGVLYILDEPTIGLHPRDNLRLINSLKQLRDLGNSVMVVEHDEEVMRNADFIVDIGPGAGIHGGKVVAAGNFNEILKSSSPTAEYLSGRKKISLPVNRRTGSGKWIEITSCTGHNLKAVSVKIPLGCIVAVTGVSGSGKSTLISDTLVPALKNMLYHSNHEYLSYKSLTGYEHIDKIIEVDQSPIGRTPRSNPVTYTKVFDEIRQLFAQLPDAKIRGFNPGRFSFNLKGGRCEKCQGSGLIKMEMDFLPDAYVVCDECNGKRYNNETLRVLYKGKNIYDVLEMSVEKALDFFENMPGIRQTLQVLFDVGLGYIKLGQPATTLSGGEAQRIKLASELCRKQTGKTIYFLDEPTTGLHFDDIRQLLSVLHKLADKGNTVVVIEHNLDIIKNADYIIDLGPDGGENGGYVLFQGFMNDFLKSNKQNLTLSFLKKFIG